MGFEWKVAFRFLKDGRGQTAFILLGIAVGVAVQVFLGKLISGLQADLINNTVGTSAHIIFSGDNGFSAENRQASAGYTFAWNGLMGAGAFGNRILRIPMPMLGVGTERVEGEMAFDLQVVAQDLGIFFADAVQ